MNVDAVIDTPDAPDDEIYELTVESNGRTHVPPGWVVHNTGTEALQLRFYANGSEVWVWQDKGGPASLHGTMGQDEGHLYRPAEDQTLTRDGMTRGPISVYRSDTYVGA
jgi:hypothetical protein